MRPCGSTWTVPLEQHAPQQATEQAHTDPQEPARDILAVLPDVVTILPRDAVGAVLSDLTRMT